MNVNIDYIGMGIGEGEIAQEIMANNMSDPALLRPWRSKSGQSKVTVFKGGDPALEASYENIAIQTNAVLRRDEWKQLDDAILPIAEERLIGISDLESRGLVYNLGNAMGTTVLEHHTISDAMEAELTMDGLSRGKNDRPKFGTVYLPIPILHVDYQINMRTLEASRKLGNPLDTTSAERATRKIAEYLEDMLFSTTQSFTFGSGSIKSYTSYGDRNQVELTTTWDTSGKTGAQIVEDVSTMKQSKLDANFYGDWMLYVPGNFETKLDEDYNSYRNETIRERIKKLGGCIDIKVSDKLADDNIVMVQMTSDVVRLINGMSIQNVQWQEEGRFVNKYKVMTIKVPQIRSDYGGACGIVHATFA